MNLSQLGFSFSFLSISWDRWTCYPSTRGLRQIWLVARTYSLKMMISLCFFLLKCDEFGSIFPHKIPPFLEVAGSFFNWRNFARRKTLAPTTSQNPCSHHGFFCLLLPNFVMWLTKGATIHNLEQRPKIWLQACVRTSRHFLQSWAYVLATSKINPVSKYGDIHVFLTIRM